MDLIDRQAALNEIAEWMLEYGALNEKRERDALQHVARGIKKLPSVQSKPDEKDHQEQGDLAEFVVKTSETCADAVSRQAAIDAVRHAWAKGLEPTQYIKELPSAQSKIAENLYLYKCYITDKDGLQHEVIHTGDIRRVTGWEI